MKRNIFFIAFIFACNNLFAVVHNVPLQYATIQLALNASNNNDTVLVQPGTYFENIVWTSVNGIKLLSAGDSSNTIIDGNQIARVITIDATTLIDSTTLIDGFKITNGLIDDSLSFGGGVFINNASPIIRHCAIVYNHLSTTNYCYGGGVYCSHSGAKLLQCSVSNNSIDSSYWAHGGGIYCEYSSIEILDCIINNNSINGGGWAYGGGIHCADSSAATITNTIIKSNLLNNNGYRCYGAGVNCTYSSPVFTNVLIASNRLTPGGASSYCIGGGICCSLAAATFINCTVTDNKRTNGGWLDGSGIYSDGDTVVMRNCILWNPNSFSIEIYSSGLDITYSDIQQTWIGTGVFNSYPYFISSTNFHLAQNSPCINTGTLNGAPSFDLENNPRPMPVGTNPDIGCYETNQTNVGLVELADETINFKIFPNPFTIELIFKGTSIKGLIVIYDLLGNMILQQHSTETQTLIQTDKLTTGFYLLKYKEENKSANFKLTKF